jgi:hypothetical protein
MPRNKLDLHLAEWRDELAAEPTALAAAADPSVNTAADAAATALRAAYPTGPTGNLKAGVRVDREPGDDPAVASADVVSGAPHAHLYEDGTRYARPHPTFYPITNSYGRDMERAVSRIVADKGYTVSGQLD